MAVGVGTPVPPSRGRLLRGPGTPVLGVVIYKCRDLQRGTRSIPCEFGVTGA